jgi:hypothetical protein
MLSLTGHDIGISTNMLSLTGHDIGISTNMLSLAGHDNFLRLSNTSDAFDFSKNGAAKWHNMNNRGCKPTVNYKLNAPALKGLNISLV